MTRNINIDLNKMPTEKCVKCGSMYFKNKTIIKKIPAILAGSTNDQFIPVDLLVCEECGTKHRSVVINVNNPDSANNGMMPG